MSPPRPSPEDIREMIKELDKAAEPVEEATAWSSSPRGQREADPVGLSGALGSGAARKPGGPRRANSRPTAGGPGRTPALPTTEWSRHGHHDDLRPLFWNAASPSEVTPSVEMYSEYRRGNRWRLTRPASVACT